MYEMHASRNDGIIEPRIILASNSSWTWDARTLVIARRFSAYNMGHVMTETAIPLIRLMMMFGVGAEQSNSSDAVAISNVSSLRDGGVLYLNDSCSDEQDRWVANGGSRACTQMSESFLFPIMRENIQRDRDSSAGVRCFQRAVFGHTVFNYLDRRGQDTDLAAEHKARRVYRDMIYQHNGLEPPSPVNPDLVLGPAITVLVKTGKRTFLNYDEIQQYLEKEWSTICGFTSNISFIDLSTSTLQDVMHVLSKTALLVTPPGSNSWTSLLLPDNATMIVGSFCTLNPAPSCNSWEVDAYHRYTPALTTLVYVPSNMSDEVVLRSRTPYYDVRLRLDALDGFVRRALAPWASQCRN